jgi:peptidoglycan biosynthesis protein MviN/MurJ (putative lipid II flippase)
LCAKAHHRVLAYCNLVETVAIVVLLIVLTPHLGLLGMALALAIPATCCRGVVLVVLGCRLMTLPLARYVRDVVVFPLLAAGVPAAALACVTAWRTPDSWPLLIAYLAIYSPLFFFIMLALLEPERVRHYGSMVLSRLRASKDKPATTETNSPGGHLKCHKLIS